MIKNRIYYDRSLEKCHGFNKKATNNFNNKAISISHENAMNFNKKLPRI